METTRSGTRSASNSTVGSQNGGAQRTATKAADPAEGIGITDMLAQVRGLWFELDADEGKLELDIKTVASKLMRMKALPDLSTSVKYIQQIIQKPSLSHLDFDNFNSIFSKGIFKFVMMNMS